MVTGSDSFISQCLAGQASAEQIDDYVDRWRDASTDQPLHEYLGMSWDEYRCWVEQPDMLNAILAARKTRMSLTYIRHLPLEQLQAALQAPTREEAKSLLHHKRRTW